MSSPEPTAPAAPEGGGTAAEPLMEGFFVARIAGEEEVQRHHLTETTSRQPGEALVPDEPDAPLEVLPASYGDDTLVLLPRDPHTLFALWDFHPSTQQRARGRLENARVVMRVYEDSDVLVRVLDVSLASRAQYIHDLPAGRPYRVELHFVDPQGHSRRLGLSSNRAVLPSRGPSPDTSVRFLRWPRGLAPRAEPGAVASLVPLRTEPVEERSYITWRRVRLPDSQDATGRADTEHPRRPPEAPGEAPPAREYLQVRRAEGSSEQGAGWGGVGARTEGPVDRAAPWLASHGPAGSSEQGPASASPWWMESSGPAGSSERGLSRGPEGTSGGWMDSHGPVGSSEQGLTRGPTGSSERWLWSHGPAGSSERGADTSGGWMGSHGPAGSSEQGAAGASGGWMGSHGPAGSSEQGQGARGVERNRERWVWVHGPVDASGSWTESHGPAGSSEQGTGSRGPGGSSEQWVWSQGPAGSSDQVR